MRGSITLFEDQYQFFKELKSKRLLVAFVEFMFEDIEPEGLNGIEKTVFNSLRVRMENQKKKSFAGTQSHGGGRPRNDSSELSSKNNTKTTNKTTEKQEVEDKDNISSYEDIYSAYYGKKGIDKKVCDKLINNLLNQGTKLDDIKKSMVLYNCECRLKQEYRYVKKFETRIREYQPLTDDEIHEEICRLARDYKFKVNNDVKFQNSQVAKTIRTDLCDMFGEEKIREIWKSEGRKQIALNLN